MKRLSALAALAAIACAVAAVRPATAATPEYRCSALASRAYLHTLTGLETYAPPSTRSGHGRTVTCLYSFLPVLIDRFGESHGLKFEVTSDPVEIARLRQRLPVQPRPYPGLGRHAAEFVALDNIVNVVALEPRFAINVQSGDRRMSPTQATTIARRLYVLARRGVFN